MNLNEHEFTIFIGQFDNKMNVKVKLHILYIIYRQVPI